MRSRPRTKAALAAAKANGKRLGNYQRIAEAKQRATAARAEAVRPVITETMHLSTQAAADELNCRGIRTRAASDGTQWRCYVRAVVSDYDDEGLQISGVKDRAPGWSKRSFARPVWSPAPLQQFLCPPLRALF